MREAWTMYSEKVIQALMPRTRRRPSAMARKVTTLDCGAGDG